MTGFMKTVSDNLRQITYFTLISQLLMAASKPCKRERKQGKDSNKRKTNEWRKKQRLTFLLIFISSSFNFDEKKKAWLGGEFFKRFNFTL